MGFAFLWVFYHPFSDCFKPYQKGALMRPFHLFTRGGQLAVHQVRMLKQICMVTFALSLASGITWGLASALRNAESVPWSLAKDFWIASFRVETSLGNPAKIIQDVRLLTSCLMSFPF